MKNLLTIPVLFIAFTWCNAQKSTLALNLKKGEAYTHISSSKSSIQQEIGGQKINMVLTIGGNMSFLVTAIDDEGFDLDVEYKSLSMAMELPQGAMEFSSEKDDENDIFSRILAEMRNKKFQIKMTRYGKVTEVRNIDTFFESVFSGFPEIPEAQLAQLQSQLLKAYGEKAFKGNVEMVTAIYPESRVKEGDEWDIKVKLESGMSANMTTTYKYAESTKEYNIITGDSKIMTEDKEAYIESNGMPMRFDLAGNMSSNIKIDKKSGWIVEATINQQIQGDTFIKENAQMPNGMKIPMMMKNEMTVTR